MVLTKTTVRVLLGALKLRLLPADDLQNVAVDWKTSVSDELNLCPK